MRYLITLLAALAPIPATALPPGNTCALVLQGGGALGAYQGGAYEALAAAGHEPDWLAGISIGAINSALIAGNPPQRRAEQLREFWHRVTAHVPPTAWAGADGPLRAWANDWAAAWGAAFGLPAFFQARPGAALWPGEIDGPSLYDTDVEAQVTALACSAPPAGRKRWTLVELEAAARREPGLDRLSRETVRRMLKKTTSSHGGA